MDDEPRNPRHLLGLPPLKAPGTVIHLDPNEIGPWPIPQPIAETRSTPHYIWRGTKPLWMKVSV